MAGEAVSNRTTSGILGSFHHAHATPYTCVSQRVVGRSEEAGSVRLESKREDSTRSERHPCAAHSVEIEPDNDTENNPMCTPSSSKGAFNIPIPRSPLTTLFTNTPNNNGFTSPTPSSIGTIRIPWEAKGKEKAVNGVREPSSFFLDLKKAKKIQDGRLTHVAPPPFPPYSAVRDVLEDPIEYIEIDSDDDSDDETDDDVGHMMSHVHDEMKVQLPRLYHYSSASFGVGSASGSELGLERLCRSKHDMDIPSAVSVRCGEREDVGVDEEESSALTQAHAPVARLVIKLPARGQSPKKRTARGDDDDDDDDSTTCSRLQGQHRFKLNQVEGVEACGGEQPARKRRRVGGSSEVKIASEDGGKGFLEVGLKGTAKRGRDGGAVKKAVVSRRATTTSVVRKLKVTKRS